MQHILEVCILCHAMKLPKLPRPHSVLSLWHRSTLHILLYNIIFWMCVLSSFYFSSCILYKIHVFVISLIFNMCFINLFILKILFHPLQPCLMRNSMQRHNAIMGVSCDAPQHLGIDSIVIKAKVHGKKREKQCCHLHGFCFGMLEGSE